MLQQAIEKTKMCSSFSAAVQEWKSNIWFLLLFNTCFLSCSTPIILDKIEMYFCSDFWHIVDARSFCLYLGLGSYSEQNIHQTKRVVEHYIVKSLPQYSPNVWICCTWQFESKIISYKFYKTTRPVIEQLIFLWWW